jgi:hypothetical protein
MGPMASRRKIRGAPLTEPVEPGDVINVGASFFLGLGYRLTAFPNTITVTHHELRSPITDQLLITNH